MHLIHFTAQAQERNNAGDYAGAKAYGKLALECNICAAVSHVITVIVLAITVPFAVMYTP